MITINVIYKTTSSGLKAFFRKLFINDSEVEISIRPQRITFLILSFPIMLIGVPAVYPLYVWYRGWRAGSRSWWFRLKGIYRKNGWPVSITWWDID